MDIGMDEDNSITVRMFGRETTFEYSPHWVGYSLLALRLVIGWTFFYAGVDKLLTPGWSAAGYLTNAIPAGNPFMWLWPVLAGNPVVDLLNMWGLTLVGLGLLLGAFFRFSAFWGAMIMVFYWMSSLPLEHGILIDDHVVYAFLLFGLGAFGAGRIFGLDARLEDSDTVKNRPWLKYLLG